jgi:hypothetical protein
MIPNHLPPWHTIHQQTMRWIKAGFIGLTLNAIFQKCA